MRKTYGGIVYVEISTGLESDRNVLVNTFKFRLDIFVSPYYHKHMNKCSYENI